MNPGPVDPKRGFLDGTEELINTALGRPTGGYSSITAATALNESAAPSPQLRELVDELWKQIAVNWVEAGCPSRGKSNWRWELRPKRDQGDDIRSKQPEIVLQRTIASFSREHWSNETPTGSGLSEGSAGDPGGLDLAHIDEAGAVTLIELKIRANTPVHAAFQVVRYGLALTLARLVDKQLRIIVSGPPPGGDHWRNATTAHLRVFAPVAYYKSYPDLGWFELALSEAVAEFGRKRHLPMTFRFRSFENVEALRDESAVKNRLGSEGRVYNP